MKEKRDIRKNYKFTKTEIDELERKCSELKITETDFISTLIFEKNNKKNIAKESVNYLNAINKIGNNLNQAVRLLHTKNMKDELKDYDYEQLLNKLIIIEKLLNDIYKEVK